jgi:hypothetical protein
VLENEDYRKDISELGVAYVEACIAQEELKKAHLRDTARMAAARSPAPRSPMVDSASRVALLREVERPVLAHGWMDRAAEAVREPTWYSELPVRKDEWCASVPVSHDAPAAVGLQIGGRGQKLGYFRFDRLGQKRPRAIAQNLAQPVGQNPWLNQFDNVIVGHGISLLRWRSGGSNTPTICRLPRFTPSPTFGHSSRWLTMLRCRMNSPGGRGSSDGSGRAVAGQPGSGSEKGYRG